MNKAWLTVKNISAGYGEKTVIRDICLAHGTGGILTLLGANGQGKTTLLKTICGLIAPREGEIRIDGEDTTGMTHGERASLIAYVPQLHVPGLPLTVLEMVILGRQYCRSLFSSPGKKDYCRARESLYRLGIESMEDKIFTELSGGEQRLVLIARALNQAARFIILDEPVSNLDLGNQIKLLKVLKDLADRGTGIIMSSHFPQHSLWIGARTALLSGGRILAVDKAEKVITGERLSRIYGTDISVIHHEYGSPSCEPVFSKEYSL